MTGSKKILRYYKQRMYHGRSLPARVFDFITLRLIFLCASYLWFLSLVHNQLLSAGLAVIALLMFCIVMSLVSSVRLDRFIEKERRRLTEEDLRERLALMPRQEFTRLAQEAAKKLAHYEDTGALPRYRGEACMVYPLQQLSPVSLDDMLAVYHAARRRQVSQVLLYTAVPAGPEAESFTRRLSEISIHIQPPEALIKLCRKTQAEDATDELVEKKLAEVAAEKKRKRAQPFAAGQTRKYLICAAVLIASSFLTRYALYYRLLAGVCFCLAGTSFFINSNAKQKEVNA